MIVSITKPVIVRPYPGDKHPMLEPAICFYEVEEDYKSDSGYDEVIHVRIDKSQAVPNQNTKKLTFTVIKYF